MHEASSSIGATIHWLNRYDKRSSPKDTLFGVCTLLPRRLQRNGATAFLRATKGVLGAMPFVVEAVLWTSIAVSVVLVMYMLVRRWL
jgi:hypothetical protein